MNEEIPHKMGMGSKAIDVLNDLIKDGLLDPHSIDPAWLSDMNCHVNARGLVERN
jgi:hypothetical protein